MKLPNFPLVHPLRQTTVRVLFPPGWYLFKYPFFFSSFPKLQFLLQDSCGSGGTDITPGSRVENYLCLADH